MEKMLETLYYRLYKLPELEDMEQVEVNREILRERLSAEDRKLVLRIVDDLDAMLLQTTYDSFTAGMRIGWKLAEERMNLTTGALL